MSLSEIYEKWSLSDVLDANEVLDMYDAAYDRATKEAQSKRK